jgi:hypothetical protein
MCEERERLIGYVYEECDASERQAIEEHLTSCPDCRQDIRGLRGVRQDLLAWDVPPHDAIWRPLAPPRRESPWRAMPAWAMATAAGVILAVGAAGGAAVHALLPDAANGRSTAVAEAAGAVTTGDLSSLEQRMIARMRAELDDRVRAVAVAGQPAGSGDVTATTNDLSRRVNLLTSRQDELYQVLMGVANYTDGIRSKQSGLEQSNRFLLSQISLMQGPGAAPVFTGDR